MEKLTELFEQARAAQAQDPSPKLEPDRHLTRDFFVADILDWALKGDRASMEHPFFSLSKKPDTRIRRYEHNGNSITVEPGPHGMPTIWDKDILIYAISQLIEASNQGHAINRTVRLTAHNLLVITNRSTGGRAYDLLAAAFDRLKGTVIKTDIRTNGVRQRQGFNIIDYWKIVERNPTNSRMVAIEMLLSEWLYNAVIGHEVLTLSRDYFRLDGGLERRLYELARKHCGNQKTWIIGLDLLRKKSGSSAPLWKFRQLVKQVAHDNRLPEYAVIYEAAADQVVFTRQV